MSDFNFRDAEDRLELLRLIQAERDGEISPEDEARLQQALSEDSELVQAYDEERALGQLFAEDREALRGASAGLADRINAAMANERMTPSGASVATSTEDLAPVFSIAGFLKPLASAAAVLVLIGGAFWAGRTTTSAEVASFEQEVVEKFRETVQREDLDDERARDLLDRFRRERETLADENRREMQRIARQLEEGLQELVDEKR